MEFDLSKFSPREKAFCEEYIKDLDGRAAAIRAGYAEASAKVTACRMLKKPHIIAYVDSLKEKRSERTQIDADYVLTQLGDMQRALVSEILNDNGSLKDVSEWPEVWQRMVSGIDVFEEYDGQGDDRHLVGYVKKIKLIDRARVLQMLGQHVKVNAFNNDVDVTIKGSIAERLLGARNRVNGSNQ